MASSHFSPLADPTGAGTGNVAESPRQKELLYRFLHKTGMSTNTFKKTHGLQDPAGIIEDLKELLCIPLEDLSPWLTEFEGQKQASHQNQEPSLKSSHKAAKRPRTHVEDEESAATLESTGRCFPPGSAYLGHCPKKSARCNPIWKNTPTCFFTHFKKKHLSRFTAINGTYICPCGNVYVDDEAFLMHVWEDEMVESSTLPQTSARPSRVKTVPMHPPRARQGPPLGYEQQINFDNPPESQPALVSSDSGYNTPGLIPSLAAHNPPGVTAYYHTMDQQIGQVPPQYQDPHDQIASAVFNSHRGTYFYD